MCAIEEGKYNMCYLTTRDNLKQYGSLEEMEHQTLYKNPFLQRIKQDAQFLYDKPEVINEISFAPKQAVEAHILMSGDTAGLITPLCGNGMAMAIHSAKILSGQVIDYFTRHQNREQLEKEYTRQWQQVFARRLWAGRHIQQLFGSEWLSGLAVTMLQYLTPATRYLMKQTHGKEF
jgi:flavin-dependent dehydrogenase